MQRERFFALGVPQLLTNAEADGDILTKIATPDARGQKLLMEAAEKMKLSARGYHRVLRVARTIADLAGRESLDSSHIAEALSYRRLQSGLLAAA
jgi:magnesium chelatase family protein